MKYFSHLIFIVALFIVGCAPFASNDDIYRSVNVEYEVLYKKGLSGTENDFRDKNKALEISKYYCALPRITCRGVPIYITRTGTNAYELKYGSLSGKGPGAIYFYDVIEDKCDKNIYCNYSFEMSDFGSLEE